MSLRFKSHHDLRGIHFRPRNHRSLLFQASSRLCREQATFAEHSFETLASKCVFAFGQATPETRSVQDGLQAPVFIGLQGMEDVTAKEVMDCLRKL